ncbi:monothiol glutaredoxin grx5 [Clydaea vesicula]|uniref:Monothiol glutaredoxin-5, mitochondrial n=1 Tax=Clydaea vesicula TaxID=447962 RepID=A0AAD5U1J8_9FUNG|nr:monothiol glutaredoxin grx5 [Clydaea vesicula]
MEFDDELTKDPWASSVSSNAKVYSSPKLSPPQIPLTNFVEQNVSNSGKHSRKATENDPEKQSLINLITELQDMLIASLQKIDSAKEEYQKNLNENQILLKYINNLMEAAGTNQQQLFKPVQRRWTRLISEQVKSNIEKKIASSDVVVFMKGNKNEPRCGFSKTVVQILKLNDITKFSDFNVLEDEELRSGIKEYSSWPTIPQVYVKGEFIGGCDILIDMHKNGELEKLFIDKGILVESTETEEKKI